MDLRGAPKVLIIDDDRALAAVLAEGLAGQDLTCAVVHDGQAAIEAAASSAPDLVLLDLMLPNLSGLEVCRRLRGAPGTASVPIVILTGRSDPYDKIVGFEAGADDYLVKPIGVRELGLRVHAWLRRSAAGSTGASPAPSAALVAGDLAVDTAAHRATVGGREVELTVVEFRMLCAFLAASGRALTRQELCLGTWGPSYAISERAVDTNIKRLRRKLGRAGVHLETVRGVGYRWTSPPTT